MIGSFRKHEDHAPLSVMLLAIRDRLSVSVRTFARCEGLPELRLRGRSSISDHVVFLLCHTSLTRNCASVLAQAMNAPACPANFTPNSTSTASGASVMLRKLLATAIAAGLIAANVASKLLATVSTTSEG